MPADIDAQEKKEFVRKTYSFMRKTNTSLYDQQIQDVENDLSFKASVPIVL